MVTNTIITLTYHLNKGKNTGQVVVRMVLKEEKEWYIKTLN